MLATGVDWVALSFIQRPEDLAEARKIARGRALLMSKIEKPQAVARLAEIIELSDALMVARGDLGVEMPLEAVPGIQKQITRAARRAGKPVVVATQMLESMITAPVPTRAEVSDVATAVFEGADAIMLSAEVGSRPVSGRGGRDDGPHRQQGRAAIPIYAGIINAQRSEPEATGADAISLAARADRRDAEAAAIVTYTASGTTGLRAARERPQRADHRAVAGAADRPAAVAGVGHALRRSARMPPTSTTWSTAPAASPSRKASASPATASSSPPACRCRTPGSTNMLRIAYIGSDGLGGI